MASPDNRKRSRLIILSGEGSDAMRTVRQRRYTRLIARIWQGVNYLFLQPVPLYLIINQGGAYQRNRRKI